MLRRIFSYMKEYKKYAWLALICIGVEVVLEIMVPKLMADLIDIGEKLFLIHGAKICRIMSGLGAGHGRRTVIRPSGAAIISHTLAVTTVSVHRQAPPLPQNGMQSSGNTVPRERAVAWS